MNPDFLALRERITRFDEILSIDSIEEFQKLADEEKLTSDEIALFGFNDFWFLYAQKNYPIIKYTDNKNLPYDQKNNRYKNWREVVIDLEIKFGGSKKLQKWFYPKPGVFALPTELREMIISQLSSEEIRNFCRINKKLEPLCKDENSLLWKNLWIREINNNPPIEGIKEKYLNFIYRFNSKEDIQDKIFFAIRNSALNQLKDLKNKGVNLLADDYNAIDLAASFDQFEILKYLLDLGASLDTNFIINVLSIKNYSIIGSTAASGQLEVLKYLLDLGASFGADFIINALSAEDYAAVSLAAGNGLEVIKYLLDLGAALDENFIINSLSGNDYYAFFWAIEDGHLDVLKYLFSLKDTLNENFVINALSANNYATIQSAIKKGRLEILKYLFNLGASWDDNFIINALSAENFYAIKSAAKNDQLEILKYLLSLVENTLLENTFLIPQEVKDFIKRKFNMTL